MHLHYHQESENRMPELYADPDSQIAHYVRTLPPGLKHDRLEWLANTPQAFWSGIEWDPQCDAAERYLARAKQAGQIPQLVAYSIPLRDASQYSAGGAGSIEGYKEWITRFTAAIGQDDTIVILEPDALPHIDLLSRRQARDRVELIRWALDLLRRSCPNARVYADIGRPVDWKSPKDAAGLLQAVNALELGAGFSFNVSHYWPDDACLEYGQAIHRYLGETGSFVFDCSRNGNPQMGEGFANWGNRQFGRPPQYGNTGIPGCDGWLWVKPPGECDGDNGFGAPKAGELWPAYLWNDNVDDNVTSDDMSTRAIALTSGMAQRGPAISAVPVRV